MAGIAEAVRMGQAGQRTAARDALTRLWGQADDPLHRCTIAHYLADLQESPEDELCWDERALAAAAVLTDDRARQHDASWQVQAMLPSLHLNLADVHRRLGHADVAPHHLDAARALLDSLPDGDYGTLIRQGFDRVEQALASGSSAPLETA
ncbi:hypothetical protein SAMN05421812_10570 [Asanoa hainanensis]|uniref:Tetratricopeptide repeat-containing protein n=1 Tax=Asanoa hainanensis TaxID=560556 RepID=A0A239M4J5_9ACTN|nr:hypothetical protein [Asanoa hainanensis]SNT36914.1 hypothetical protein SAMN05421812_10570 [Asanoa hainanensis]